MPNIVVAVDAMGGDFGPKVTVNAGLRALSQIKDLNLVFCGLESEIHAILDASKIASKCVGRFSVVHASEMVDMNELPSTALRQKRDSSMRVALNQVKNNHAMACVSAGNTGALMAISRFVLKTVNLIDRPAIITALPNIHGHTYILDLGANLDCSVENIFQFAVMGSVMANAIGGIDNPSVGLLNVGEEEIKGTELVKSTAKRLQTSSLNYVGYVEGDDTFIGDTDVIVCDGFAGNISLKTCEGLAKLMIHTMRDVFQSNILCKILAYFAKPVIKRVLTRLDPRNYNGATLVGLRRTVIKSHGSADELSYTNAIINAYRQVKQNVPERIRDRITTLVEENEKTA